MKEVNEGNNPLPFPYELAEKLTFFDFFRTLLCIHIRSHMEITLLTYIKIFRKISQQFYVLIKNT